MDNIAVIDIGSNSVRLLLVKDGRETYALETTRLGQGVEQHLLGDEPVARTIDAIGRFCAQARAQGAARIVAFATSAVRDARNPQALLAPVRDRFGLEIDILPGETEAQLAYLGAARGARACVLDIGGASTELVAGEGRVKVAVSLQAGAVRLQNRFGQDRVAAESFLDQAFLPQRARFAAFADAPWLGIGGTVTTLAAMQQRLTVYDPAKVDGFSLEQDAVRRWVDTLWDIPAAARTFPGLQPQRADIIAHGALILERFMSAFRCPALRTSTGDNLRGYLAHVGSL